MGKLHIHHYVSLCFLAYIFSFFIQISTLQAQIPKDTTGIWVTAYMASWNHYAPPGGNWGNLPTNKIDWSAFTQMNYFAMKAHPDGTLSKIEAYHNFNPDRLETIVSAAHNHDKPILFTVGGWGNHLSFKTAISPLFRENFIANLIQVMKKWNFDGIDIDMEPIKYSDVKDYKLFIKALYKKMQELKTPMASPPLLTVATDSQPEMFVELQQYFDQINLMTYDFSGAWRGWISWYNSPVFNAGQSFPSTHKPLPSTNEEVDKFNEAGVSREKMGIGIDFYGYIWDGVSKPRESWTIAPTVKPNVPYYKIMDKYYSKKNYHWDDETKSSYISINNNGHKKFISFDDQKAIKAKFQYARNKKIGGLIIWELTGGYRKDQPSGQKDKLLQSVSQNLNGNAESNPIVQIETPKHFKLHQNYPNPFNPTTKIKFDLPKKKKVRLTIFNLLGQKVATLVNRTLPAGTYVIPWDASSFTSGVYFYKLYSENFVKQMKMTLVK